jgi:hypothetical protein
LQFARVGFYPLQNVRSFQPNLNKMGGFWMAWFKHKLNCDFETPYPRKIFKERTCRFEGVEKGASLSL